MSFLLFLINQKLLCPVYQETRKYKLICYEHSLLVEHELLQNTDTGDTFLQEDSLNNNTIVITLLLVLYYVGPPRQPSPCALTVTIKKNNVLE